MDKYKYLYNDKSTSRINGPYIRSISNADIDNRSRNNYKSIYKRTFHQSKSRPRDKF